jgi:hypothetical protein
LHLKFTPNSPEQQDENRRPMDSISTSIRFFHSLMLVLSMEIHGRRGVKQHVGYWNFIQTSNPQAMNALTFFCEDHPDHFRERVL